MKENSSNRAGCETRDENSSAAGPGSEDLDTHLTNRHVCPVCCSQHQALVLNGAKKKLVRCKDCKVFYFDPLPSERELAAVFQTEYITTEEEVEVRFGSRPAENLRRVAHFVNSRKSGGRILDIGCAGGHFLWRFFNNQRWERWGVELSEFAAAKAAERGIRVHRGDIHSANLPERSFDSVTVLDAFYYFCRPLHELKTIRKLLKEDGILVLTLPCATGHIWRNTSRIANLWGNRRAAFFETHHVIFYDPSSLIYALNNSGFQVGLVLPLPPIDQENFFRNMAAKIYFGISGALWRLSAGRIMLASRFVVVANAC